MERRIVIASHGLLARGLKNSLEIICGEQRQVETLCAYLEEDFDLAMEVQEIIDSNKNNELIVLTDILGGSVNNEFFKYIEHDRYHLITGINLSLVIELTVQLNSMKSVQESIELLLESNKESVRYFNHFVNEEEEEDF